MSDRGLHPLRRVLVIDDEPIVRNVVVRALRAIGEVDALTSAAEGIARLRVDDHYALILCDVCMPEGLGFEVMRFVRAERPLLLARFAFMTGGARCQEDEDLMADANVPILLKPFDRRGLLTFAQRFLEADAAVHGHSG